MFGRHLNFHGLIEQFELEGNLITVCEDLFLWRFFCFKLISVLKLSSGCNTNLIDIAWDIQTCCI